ncbi:TRAP transporter large permease [Halalkalibacter krulwichiae]|uniref:Sialic acid TRAP transporter permease protein SiaT n=1 Tax=Halalkalibacter krulwichiae TaxID=199441 RepID=A0A1X9MG40_9BACI|nr:TRAP transporter large permease [Halalkalibacter krulwichiae]ARK32427.1 Sialic acid TRAP transporter permease protein SiaT [Halalkalibacter krulwichiae]
MTEIFILFGLLFLFMFLGIPIAFSLGITSVIVAIYYEIPLLLLFQNMVSGINNFTFLAVPFFILAAQIMTDGEISDKIMKFASVIVGKIRGGTAMVNVTSSMFFGGVSGSSVADVSSIGSMLIPAMKKQGYDKDYSVAVTVTSSTQGVIIPPSQNMIYYAIAAGGISISELFLAGFLPGIMLGIALMIVTYLLAVKRKYPKGRGYTLKESLHIIKEASLGILTAVIIIGGIIFGIFTATESAAVAAVYALLITTFIYKNMTFKKIKKILYSSSKTLGMIVAIIATSSAFGYVMAYLRIPTMVSNFFLTISENPIVITLLIILLLLVLGMFMDMGVLILLLTPILLPVATMAGIDPIHFGVIMVLTLGIGLCTPPVGTSLFVGCAIAGLPIEKSIKALLPFYLVMVLVVLLVTFIPSIALWIPSLAN